MVQADVGDVYWANSGSISKMPTLGGPVTILATGQSQPSQMAVSGSNVYWTNRRSGTLARAPYERSAVTTLSAGQNDTLGIAVGTTDVYWTVFDGAPGKCQRPSSAGGPFLSAGFRAGPLCQRGVQGAAPDGRPISSQRPPITESRKARESHHVQGGPHVAGTQK
jgi:hypothetical protein